MDTPLFKWNRLQAACGITLPGLLFTLLRIAAASGLFYNAIAGLTDIKANFL
jgi:hypothetical protein